MPWESLQSADPAIETRKGGEALNGLGATYLPTPANYLQSVWGWQALQFY